MGSLTIGSLRSGTALRSLGALIVAIALAGCGGGGAAAPAPVHAVGDTVIIGSQPTTATLPVSGGITGSMTFPAVNGSLALQLAASTVAPVGATLQRQRGPRASGTLSVYEYLTLTPSVTIAFPTIPAFTLTLPATIPTAGKSFFYGISDASAANPPPAFTAHGPAAVNGQTITFLADAGPLTVVAGQSYTFIVYATYAAPAASGPRIYVAQAFDANIGINAFDADGTPATPARIGALQDPGGVAVDGAGKIYVTDAGTLRTFAPDGSPSTPTITGLQLPAGVAVDSAGKIYVVNTCCVSTTGPSTWSVTTYKPDGTPTTPTITARLSQPTGIAVDRNGKIYVLNTCCQGSIGPSTWGVVTYAADGTPATPTIVGADDANPAAIAVDANGTIYVANANFATPFGGSITTYRSDGSPTAPTIGNLADPTAVAVDAAGKIYVGTDRITTYTPNGTATVPTIDLGVNAVAGAIAVHQY